MLVTNGGTDVNGLQNPCKIADKSDDGRARAGTDRTGFLPGDLCGADRLGALAGPLRPDRELGSDRSTSWIAADVALALGAQAVLGAVVWVALGWGRLAAAITLILAVIPAVYAVNVAYMATIPSMFLIEDDTTPDTGDLPVACALPQVWLVPAQAGLTRASTRAAKRWSARGRDSTASCACRSAWSSPWPSRGSRSLPASSI